MENKFAVGADSAVRLAKNADVAYRRNSMLCNAAQWYANAGMSLHARACAMAYTADDYDVCEGKSCVTRAKCWACVVSQSGQGALDLLVGLAVVAVIMLGAVLLFGQYHAGDMFAFLPH